MKEKIFNYLESQRTGVLAVEMLDGSPHAATVHFAYSQDPLVFYFETQREYRKAESLTGREKSRASLVIGTDEMGKKTFQLDGFVRIINKNEVPIFEETYLGKFPEKKEQSQNPDLLFFVFEPTWWRFTDWATLIGKEVTLSTDH
jgi:general stress protein 26